MNDYWKTHKPGQWLSATFMVHWKDAPSEQNQITGQISPCGQFSIDLREVADEEEVTDWWVITHLATGRRIEPTCFSIIRDMSEAEIKRFAEAISPLADWNALNASSPERFEIAKQASPRGHSKSFQRTHNQGDQMTKEKLQLKVTEAVNLDREIAEMTEQLKLLKSELFKVAKEATKTPTIGGGWSVVLMGNDGCVARITRPGSKLKASLDGGSTAWGQILTLLGDKHRHLFETQAKYAPIDNFRTELASMCVGVDERKVLKLVTGDSSVTVSFETKEAA